MNFFFSAWNENSTIIKERDFLKSWNGNNNKQIWFFFVHFRESSGPLTAKIDSTNANLELKVDVNKTTLALIPRREQLEANSPVTKPCLGEKEWV